MINVIYAWIGVVIVGFAGMHMDSPLSMPEAFCISALSLLLAFHKNRGEKE